MNPGHLRPIPHHSTADWARGVACMLDPTHTISPPNSLANQEGAQCYCFLSHDDGFNIVDGRIIVSIYAVPGAPPAYNRTALAFRCRAFPSYPLTPRFYDLVIYHDAVSPPGSPRVKLFRNIDLFPTLLAEWHFDPPLNAWTTYRLSWIADPSQPDPKPLLITAERQSAPVWLLIGSYSDPMNLGADEDSNQVGMSLYDHQHWVDDFYLYEHQPP